MHLESIQLLAHSARQLLASGYMDGLQPIASGAAAFSNVLMDYFVFRNQVEKEYRL